jgi:energy-coupling factor transport system permease protein
MNPYHPVAWLVWLLAAALSALVTRNPLYLVLILLAAGVTYLALDRRSPTARSWGGFVRLGVLLLLFSVPINALTVHQGRLVLLRLPETWPIIGGAITGEATLYGFSTGLSLLALLLVFATFSSAVDQARLLRLTPPYLYQAGVTAAIAVAFVPQMMIASREIREAQRIRGHHFRGVRDLLPLFMPLLTTGLERAIALAESMEARGFSNTPAISWRRQTLYRLGTLVSLLALSAGTFGYAYFVSQRALSVGIIAAAAMTLLLIFWRQGREVKRTRYRRWRWRRRDTAITLVCGAVVFALLVVWLARGEALLYYPYAPYSPWPSFQPLIGLTLALLALPGLLSPRTADSQTARGDAPASSPDPDRNEEPPMSEAVGM